MPLGVLALMLGLEPALLGGESSLATSPPPAEKSSSSFAVEVVLSFLLAVIVLALVSAGGWYWMKRRRLASGTLSESGAPQGFDNITFRDVRTGRGEGLYRLPPTAPKQHFPKSSANPNRFPLSPHSANASGRCKGLCLLSGCR